MPETTASEHQAASAGSTADSTAGSTAGSTADSTPGSGADAEEILVEEISIDGMCGVY
jgi:mycofactocin precursor